VEAGASSFGVQGLLCDAHLVAIPRALEGQDAALAAANDAGAALALCSAATTTTHKKHLQRMPRTTASGATAIIFA